MVKSITVPLHLLEDIFRLLEYLDRRGYCDELHFHRAGYSNLLERDNAFWELGLKIRQLQGQIEETYLLTVSDVTEDEKHAFREWVAAGNNIYDNPYSLFNESGCPMDFINGYRLGSMMFDNPSEFFGCEPDDADGGWDDELPF